MFKNRKDGAIQLAKALDQYRNTDAIVLGIPRGGAETGFYVAQHLNTEFYLIISRKLGHPHNPEYAFGAIAEDGSIYLNEAEANGLSQQIIDEAVKQQKIEINRRVQTLRKGKPLPALKNKTVILVDDGIATGSTLYAAIEMCKKQETAKIIVAAPVGPQDTKQKLEEIVDEVVILEIPHPYYAVSQGYESFYNLTDEEALEFMEEWEKHEKINKF